MKALLENSGITEIPEDILNPKQLSQYNFMLDKKEDIQNWWLHKKMNYTLICIELDKYLITAYINWRLVAYFINREIVGVE